MLSPLPAEVLLIVADYLERKELGTLLRVNSFFHSVFVRPLYESVEAFVEIVREDSIDFDSYEYECTVYPPLGDATYSQHVRSITVREHDPEICEGAPEHDVLHVHLIRLFLNSDCCDCLLHDGHGCWDRAGTAQPRLPVKELACQFLLNVRSSTLVIAEILYGSVSPASVLQPWMDAITNTVLFVPPYRCVLESGAVNARVRAVAMEVGLDLNGLLRQAPRALRSFTAVLQHPGEGLYTGPDAAPKREYAAALRHPPRQLVRGVVDVCEDLGARSCPIFAKYPDLEELTFVLPEGVLSLACRRYLVSEMEQHLAQTKRLGGKPLPTVRILSMLEFMAHPEYKGVMTRQQERTWLSRSSLRHYAMTTDEVAQCINWSRRCREVLRRNYPDPDGVDYESFEASLLPPPWETS